MSLPVDPVLVVAVAVTALVLFLLVRGGKSAEAVSYPYVMTDSLFTPAERRFLRVLEQASGEYRVFGKVRVADLVGVRKGLPRGERQRALNRISQKHVDFVLCHPHDSVYCAIELDDKSHERADRRARDAFLEQALGAAQVPLVRVPTRKTYEVDELRTLLDALTAQKAA